MTRSRFWRRDRDLAALQDPALAPLQAALIAPPAPDELAAEDQALTAFRAVTWDRAAAPARRRPLWRPAVLSSVLSTALTTKLSAALAAGAVGLSGAAAVAYTGNLPDTLQDAAHKTIKAPAAQHDPKPAPTQAVGPDATGSAAYGLCQAFAKEKEHGKATERSVAYRNLVRAAGGEEQVAAYCAAVPRPSDATSAEPDEAATGTPSPRPSGKSSDHKPASPGARGQGHRATPAPTR